jgi:hypothetical protein
MSTITPIPRQTRQVLITAIGGQTVFGPIDFPLFAADDAEVWVKTTPTAAFSKLANEQYTVTPASPETSFPAPFVVTLASGRAAGDIVWIKGARLGSRLTDVTRGGRIQSAPLESELDRQVATEQELRRDIDALIAGGASGQLIASGVANNSTAPGGTVADALAAIDDKADANAASVSTLSARVGSLEGAVATFPSNAVAAAAILAPTVLFLRTTGYYTAGDGGGALYVRVGSQPAHAGKIQSSGGIWWEIADDALNIKQFGARSDGTTNDASAISAAQTAAIALGRPSLSFLRGATKIATALTLSIAVTMAAGASLQVDGTTVNINGSFNAPWVPIFGYQNGGSVSFGPKSCRVAPVEWWGAAGDGVTDDILAINAALQAHLNVCAGSSGYRTSDSILINRHNVTFFGNALQATTIAINSATKDAIKIVGFGSGIPNYVVNPTVRDIQVARLQPPTTPVSNDTTGACGVRVSRALRALLQRVFSVEDFIGFYFGETIDAIADRCVCARASGTSGDRYYGFYYDGRSTASAPNGSLRSLDCVVGIAFAGTSYGHYANGHFADLFVMRPITGGTTHGIRLKGPTGDGQPDDRQTIDVQIVGPVLDIVPSGGTGLWISDLPLYGSINVAGGYAALASGSTGSLVKMDSVRGVSIGKGFQFIGWPSSSSSSYGLALTGCSNINVDGLYQDCLVPAVLNNCHDIQLTGSIYNNSQATGATAVTVGGTSSNIDVSVGIDGAASGQFANGVLIANTASNVIVNASRIVSAAVTKRISNNGTSITADGYFGTGCLAIGTGSAASAPTAATQADQESASSTSVFVSPARQQYHPSAAKAWVAYQGTGTPGVLASYNVSSVTRASAANYTVNWTTAFSSGNYAAIVQGNDNGSGAGSFALVETISASSIYLVTVNPSTLSQADASRVCALAFGDQ